MDTIKLKLYNADGSDAGEKIIYSPDERASDWIREDLKKRKTFDAPQMSSATEVKQTGRGTLVKGALGYFTTAGNNVQHNAQLVNLVSSCFSNGNGISVIPENFDKVAVLFTARRTIISTWQNNNDEYMCPNEKHHDYPQWNHDCLVYALFNNKSQQSSLRDVSYKGQDYSIKNNFFFSSINVVKDLATKHKNMAVYQDALAFPNERFVFQKLSDPSWTLSTDAQEILAEARRLLELSFSFWPAYGINVWDPGWVQIKSILKERFSDEYKAFVAKYKKFEDRLREGVYTFGFLLR